MKDQKEKTSSEEDLRKKVTWVTKQSCPVHCRLLNRISNLCSVDANNTLDSCDNQKSL